MFTNFDVQITVSETLAKDACLCKPLHFVWSVLNDLSLLQFLCNFYILKTLEKE